MRTTLERVVTPLINEQLHERCESDPMWFLTGPLQGRPKPTHPVNPDPGCAEAARQTRRATVRALRVRRRVDRIEHRDAAVSVGTAIPTAAIGRRGLRAVSDTSWYRRANRCHHRMARQPLRGPSRTHAALPGEGWNRVLLFSGVFVVCFLVALAATTPTVWRVRRLAADARESADENYASIAPDNSKDEIQRADIRLQRSGQGDPRPRHRDDGSRRRDATICDDDRRTRREPLAELDASLVRGPTDSQLPTARPSAANSTTSPRTCANLVAAARLRGNGEPIKRDEVDLAKRPSSRRRSSHADG